jgi:hypothetical protein
MFSVKVEFPDGPEKAVVTFPAEAVSMNASDVADLIESLGRVRTGMRPEVPRDPKLGAVVSTVADPRFWVAPEGMVGGVLLSLRHPGLGWLYFQIPSAEIETLVALLQKHTVAIEAGKGHAH